MDRGGFKQENKKSNYNSNNKPEEDPIETITPVLMSWLNAISNQNQKDDVIKLDDIIIDKVTVVGRIIKVDMETSKIKLTVEDGTGVLTLTCNKKQDEGIPKSLLGVPLEFNNKRERLCALCCPNWIVRRQKVLRASSRKRDNRS